MARVYARRPGTAFGKEVKKWTIDHNLKTKDLAVMVEISPQYLSDILSGVKAPRKHVRTICTICGLDFEEYFQLKKGA